MAQTLEYSKLADKLWSRYAESFPKLVRFDPPKIILSRRLSKCAGYCDTEERVITLGAKFCEQFSGNMRNVILPHEIAHQIDSDLNGWYPNKRHHGTAWQAIMMTIGQAPNPYHSMVLS